MADHKSVMEAAEESELKWEKGECGKRRKKRESMRKDLCVRKVGGNNERQ